MGSGVDILADALFLGNTQHEGNNSQNGHNMYKGAGLPNKKTDCPSYKKDDRNDI